MGRFISKKDAAGMLGVSVKTVERLIQSGEIDAYKIGRLIRINTDDIAAYLNSKKIKMAASQIRKISYNAGNKLV